MIEKYKKLRNRNKKIVYDIHDIKSEITNIKRDTKCEFLRC